MVEQPTSSAFKSSPTKSFKSVTSKSGFQQAREQLGLDTGPSGAYTSYTTSSDRLPTSSAFIGGSGGGGSQSSKIRTTRVSPEEVRRRELEKVKTQLESKRNELKSSANELRTKSDALTKIQNALNRGSFIKPEWIKQAGLKSAFVNQAIVSKRRNELSNEISDFKKRESSFNKNAEIVQIEESNLQTAGLPESKVSKTKVASSINVGVFKSSETKASNVKTTFKEPEKPKYGLLEAPGVAIYGTAADIGGQVGRSIGQAIGPEARERVRSTVSQNPLGAILMGSFGKEKDSVKSFKEKVAEPAGALVSESFFFIGAGKLIGLGAGAVAGATKGTRLASAGAKVAQATEVFAPVSTRIPAPLRSGAARLGTIGAGLGLQFVTAGSGAEGVKQGAKTLALETGISEEKAREIVRASNLKTQGAALAGVKQTQVSDTGEEIGKSFLKPEIGKESGEILGSAQRFVSSNVPGIIPFIAPESSKLGAEEALKEAGLPASEKNVSLVIEAQKTSGAFSTAGMIGTEVGSELLAAGIMGRGTQGLRSATTVKQQQKELIKTVVPATVVAGFGEGASQTANVGSLTQKNVPVVDIAVGGVYGGITSGLFGAATAQFTPKGKGGLVNLVGSAIDFPGESIGDFLAGGLKKVSGQGSLRIPILTSSGITPSMTKTTSNVNRAKTQTRTKGFSSAFTESKGKTKIPGLGTVPTDMFGLPLSPTETRGNGGGKTPGSSLTPSDSVTTGLDALSENFGNITNIFQSTPTDVTSQTETQSTVNITSQSNVNFPSTVNVPSLTPAGLPFLPVPPPFLGSGRGGGLSGKRRVKYINELNLAITSFKKGFVRRPSKKTKKKSKRRS